MSTPTSEHQHPEAGTPQRFFAEFPYPAYETWRAEVESTLKGAAFERKLIKKTYEGISTLPLYRPEDVAHLSHITSLPGFAPFVRGTRAAGYLPQPWLIAQELPYALPTEFNKALHADLERGQTAVNLPLDVASRTGHDPDQAAVGAVGLAGVSIASVDDLAEALEGVDLTQVPIFIQAGASGLGITTLLVALLRRQGRAVAQVRGAIGGDPLGTLAATGSLPTTLERAYAELAALTIWACDHAPNLATIEVQATFYHDAGGHAVQELAYAMATGVEYIRAMLARGLSIDDVAPRMRFAFAVGSNFFMEIAKLRAARLVWSRIVAAFGGSAESQKLAMHARTSRWNKTQSDPYVNMLRTTTEAFAAAMGGCDSMHVGCFDEVIRLPDEFARRIARNTQIILQQECLFTDVIDPAGGAWYIEHLTDEVARMGWALFQEIEKAGGMLAALQAGTPQQQIAATASERIKSLATRKDILVGTNMYPNLKEKPLELHEPDYAALHRTRAAQLAEHRTHDDTADHTTTLDKLAQMLTAAPDQLVATAIAAAQAGATLGELTRTLRTEQAGAPISVTPLRMQRGSELFEGLRAAAEAHLQQHGERPQVFLATMGPLVQHKARADFAQAFLEVGGFGVQYPHGFDTAEAAAQAALASGAPIVVICSTDETYPDLVAPITQQIKATNPAVRVVLAGYPQDQVEAHKAAGVDDFVHLRANVYQTLQQLQQQIGVSA
ncbi:MAG: methylmalonyl-CoA mutase [Chloroflexaceae bacterium]|nr:methylmalonyl-CoA mutase [Chloroflexaceae bacterium]NJO06360.1 methylmalonyl-CoA mutase [Chloroflexaceae bacterium]